MLTITVARKQTCHIMIVRVCALTRNAKNCSRSQAQNKFVSASGAQRRRVDKQNSSNQRVDTLELVKQ